VKQKKLAIREEEARRKAEEERRKAEEERRKWKECDIRLAEINAAGGGEC